MGIWNRELSAKPKTGYLMTYNEKGCNASCLFCPQARGKKPEKLSRVSWPKIKLEDFKEKLSLGDSKFKRFCIQALNYSGVVDDICEIVSEIAGSSEVPISVSCQPIEENDMRKLAERGVERLGIPIDATTPRIFDFVKGKGTGGPYKWKSHIEALDKAKSIFNGKVSTHLIIGLGETEKEVIQRIQFFKSKGVTIGLFAFTPISGSKFAYRDRPSLVKYRRVQIAKYLIENDISSLENMKFDKGILNDFGISSDNLKSVISLGDPFITSGCPDCNRPYYNESPSGPIYNFPNKPSIEDVNAILKEFDY